MKRIFFCCALSIISFAGFAQSLPRKATKGFYLNPNFKHTAYRVGIPNQQMGFSNQLLFTPNLTLGYMWGQRNRHNISLTALRAFYRYGTTQVNTELRYSYDILALRKNKFSFYISPYLKENYWYGRFLSLHPTGSSKFIQNTHSLSIGIAPVFEYQLGRRIDFVASLPLDLATANFTTRKIEEQQNTQQTSCQYNTMLRQGEAKIGIRLNLFRKKK